MTLSSHACRPGLDVECARGRVRRPWERSNRRVAFALLDRPDTVVASNRIVEQIAERGDPFGSGDGGLFP